MYNFFVFLSIFGKKIGPLPSLVYSTGKENFSNLRLSCDLETYVNILRNREVLTLIQRLSPTPVTLRPLNVTSTSTSLN